MITKRKPSLSAQAYSKHMIGRIAVADHVTAIIYYSTGVTIYRVTIGSRGKRITKRFKTFEEAIAFRNEHYKTCSYKPRSFIERTHTK